jgi:flagellar motor switch protein FliM
MDKNVQSYNFRRPDRISTNQIRSLHFVHDRFARNVSSSISAYLRIVVEVALEDISQVAYAEFLNCVTDPTCYTSISLKPLLGLAALEIGPDLVFPMIDRLLGGVGRPIANPRPMTEIEQKIIEGVLKVIVDNLRESWRQVYAIDFALMSTETHPHMVQITAPTEMVVHFQFQVCMRDMLTKIHVAIPTLMLEPILHIFDQEESSRRKVSTSSTLLHQIRNVPVSVSLATVDTLFPMQELLTEFCWGALWTRPGLDRRTRSIVNLAMLGALNRPHELKLHVKGALKNGLTKDEIKEILLQVAVYCGIPSGIDAFRNAREAFKEVEGE